MSDLQTSIEHPAPTRGGARAGSLFAALAGAPTAWVLQLLATFGISSDACSLTQGAHGQQRAAGFAGEVGVLLAINLVCLVAATASGLLSWRHLRRAHRADRPSIGDGRTRFIAFAGVLTAVAFVIAIAFGTVQPLLLPTCWSYR